MESSEIKYVYRRSEEAELEPLLSRLQERLGGQRSPYSSKSGAIDLVSCLELFLVFTASISLRPVLQKYFEGLLNADGLKKLGEQHRKDLVNWFQELEGDLAKVLNEVHLSLGLIHTSLTFGGDDEAIVLEVPTYSGSLYVTLNHKDLSLRLIKSLPKGIINAVRFVCENGFPERAVVFQLYFDVQSEEWVYLFAPTANGFGNYIDRYVDLRDGEIKYLASRSEFIQAFNPACEDSLKFLVSPFR